MTRTGAEIHASRYLPRKATRLEIQVIIRLADEPGLPGTAFGPRFGTTLRMLERHGAIVWRADGWQLPQDSI